MFSKYTNKESIKKLLTRTKDVIEVIKDESTKTISSIKDKIDEKSKNWEPLDKDNASENNKDNVSENNKDDASENNKDDASENNKDNVSDK